MDSSCRMPENEMLYIQILEILNNQKWRILKFYWFTQMFVYYQQLSSLIGHVHKSKDHTILLIRYFLEGRETLTTQTRKLANSQTWILRNSDGDKQWRTPAAIPELLYFTVLAGYRPWLHPSSKQYNKEAEKHWINVSLLQYKEINTTMVAGG